MPIALALAWDDAVEEAVGDVDADWAQAVRVIDRPATNKIRTLPKRVSPCQRYGGSCVEGDGWVNWSGLATLLTNIAKTFARELSVIAWPTLAQTPSSRQFRSH